MLPSWLAGALWVGVGGFVGSVLRYAASGLVHGLARTQTFPYGTLAVNVSGCFVIGVLAGVADARHVLAPNTRVFLLLGVLGGFTTFSTFGYETLMLARDADYLRAGVNVVAQLLLGLGAVWLGLVMTRAW